MSLGIMIVNNRLKTLSLSQNEPFLEDSQLTAAFVLGKFYNMFGSEPLLYLQLGIPNLLK